MENLVDKEYYSIAFNNLIALVQRANKAIAFHLTAESPDQDAIENYNRLKKDYAEQMKELVEEMLNEENLNLQLVEV